jgi:hypothetical protein
VAPYQYARVGSTVSGGVGVVVADPGRIPRIPPVTGAFGTWFGAVS